MRALHRRIWSRFDKTLDHEAGRREFLGELGEWHPPGGDLPAFGPYLGDGAYLEVGAAEATPNLIKLSMDLGGPAGAILLAEVQAVDRQLVAFGCTAPGSTTSSTTTTGVRLPLRAYGASRC